MERLFIIILFCCFDAAYFDCSIKSLFADFVRWSVTGGLLPGDAIFSSVDCNPWNISWAKVNAICVCVCVWVWVWVWVCLCVCLCVCVCVLVVWTCNCSSNLPFVEWTRTVALLLQDESHPCALKSESFYASSSTGSTPSKLAPGCLGSVGCSPLPSPQQPARK